MYVKISSCRCEGKYFIVWRFILIYFYIWIWKVSCTFSLFVFFSHQWSGNNYEGISRDNFENLCHISRTERRSRLRLYKKRTNRFRLFFFRRKSWWETNFKFRSSTLYARSREYYSWNPTQFGSSSWAFKKWPGWLYLHQLRKYNFRYKIFTI